MELKILHGDNLELLKDYPDNYFDSVVTDCPYGLGKEPNALKLLQDWIDHGYHEIKGKGFMGKHWDSFVPQPKFWKEVFRVLKPGGYVLAFFGTRTYDWGTLAIRLAGFEIRDMICWHYGSGFPKSLDISKQLDKISDQQRPKSIKKVGDINNSRFAHKGKSPRVEKMVDSKTALSNEAKQWDGWGTALKPATEPICVARKPIEGTVAENVLKYGTGGINLDGCRIENDNMPRPKSFGDARSTLNTYGYYKKRIEDWEGNSLGRFPSNVIFDDFTSQIIDNQSGVSGDKRTFRTEAKGDSCKSKTEGFGIQGGRPVGFETPAYGDFGGASRFFYCAKASQFERNAGCEDLNKQKSGVANEKGRSFNGVCINSGKRLQVCDCGNCKHDQEQQIATANFHPTVKPLTLMSYLQRLVTPKGGKTLDPFAGSGTSGCSAYFEDIGEIVLMEMDETYLPIIEARTKYWSIERNRHNYLDEIRVKKEDIVENQMKLF